MCVSSQGTFKFFDNIVFFVCLNPVSIKNPNYGKKIVAGDPFSLKDCSSPYIKVPCGHCPQCIAVRQMYLIQRVQMESLENYIFFCTLTYNNDMLPSLVLSNCRQICFADIRDLQNMFKRLRVNNSFGRPFKYMYVSELGSKRGRPHFHVLFFVPKYKDDTEYTPISLESQYFKIVLSEWKRKVSLSKKFVEYKPLCTYEEIFKGGKRYSNFDFHYVKPYYLEDSFSNVGFYVLKYMLKPSDRETRLQQALHLNLSEEEYRSVWKIVKSKCVVSKGFGLALSPFGDPADSVVNHLRRGIELNSNSEFPQFYNPSNGKSFPLSRFYRNKFYTYQDALNVYFRSDSDSLDSPIVTEPKNLDQVIRDFAKFQKIVDSVAERGDFDSISDEFD